MSIRTIVGFSMLAALTAAGPTPGQTQETPAQILGRVDARLLAWDTTAARELLATLPDQGTPEARIAAGRVLLQEQKLDESTAQLESAVAASPGDPSPAIYLGEAYRLAKRPEDAQRAFETAAQRAANRLAATPENVGQLVALGVARQNLRQLPESIAALEQARQLAPGNVQAAYQLGVTQALARNWAQSVELLTQALEKSPEIAYAYYFRALAADKIDRKDLLINDLERFLALAPNAPEAPRARSLLESLQG